MEDPTAVQDIGLELRLEAQVGSLALRGIIDRLDLQMEGFAAARVTACPLIEVRV